MGNICRSQTIVYIYAKKSPRYGSGVSLIHEHVVNNDDDVLKTSNDVLKNNNFVLSSINTPEPKTLDELKHHREVLKINNNPKKEIIKTNEIIQPTTNMINEVKINETNNEINNQNRETNNEINNQNRETNNEVKNEVNNQIINGEINRELHSIHEGNHIKSPSNIFSRGGILDMKNIKDESPNTSVHQSPPEQYIQPISIYRTITPTISNDGGKHRRGTSVHSENPLRCKSG